ncbi:exodeoxyribonuclease VII large subunit [Amnibacterium setariae]|uniref:Exodeoxyribonuclease 7 large subunit n=1 Tax=Amnibacterium setariae TaxID=2306585 RepID=A0A3A1U625_9MICO|nr:exodeoxyribonuclease VII large subunit [Amnibacterium setariae]RIX30907.1 exodeoxyribonuclease VII large subunit [Amnibacterium setariae]
MSDGVGTAETPWSVGVLGDKLKGWIDRLGQVWVEGEITQWGVRGANVYGKLKDLERDVTVSFQIWSSVKSRLPADLKQGDRVIALVKPDYWLKAGSISMQVFQMKHVGLGDLLERLELLRRTLAAEGLFDPARKRRLPFLPHRIGLITGKDSDAEKDVIRNAQLRWPSVDFRVVHAAVQGDRTVPEVLAALAALDADPEVDVIVIARGGGDFQNLLGFSDERLLRAVAAARTPVVSAIGHDNDRPLLDDVADLRASTPTDAAKRVVPDVTDELNGVSQARARIRNRLTQTVRMEADRVASLRQRRVLADGGWIVDSRADELTRWAARSAELVDRAVDAAERRLAEARGHLRALSPLRTLERGYAIVLGGDGAALRHVADAPTGTPLTVRVVDGAVAATSEGAVDREPADRAEPVGARS